MAGCGSSLPTGAGRGGCKPTAHHEPGAAALQKPFKSGSHCSYCPQGDCEHIPCSVPQFPPLQLKALVTDAESAPEYAEFCMNTQGQTASFFTAHPTIAEGNEPPILCCRKAEQTCKTQQKQLRSVCFSPRVSSFGRPTTRQRTRLEGGCCSLGKAVCFHPRPRAPGAQAASWSSAGFPMEEHPRRS